MQNLPNIPLEAFDQAKTLIYDARKILIISHVNPDADAVGANLALREAIERLGKVVDSACVDPPPENCAFLPLTETYLSQITPSDYDLLISVDCGGHKLLGFHKEHPEILDRNKVTLINFDHHASNDYCYKFTKNSEILEWLHCECKFPNTTKSARKKID